MNLDKRQAFFEALKNNNPHPTTELEYSTPFELLAAVLLSAQATDVSVNKGTRNLYPIANTPEKIYALGEEGLIPYIQHIGLYKTKAKNILKNYWCWRNSIGIIDSFHNTLHAYKFV